MERMPSRRTNATLAPGVALTAMALLASTSCASPPPLFVYPCSGGYLERPRPSLHHDPAPLTVHTTLRSTSPPDHERARAVVLERERAPTNLTVRAVGKIGLASVLAVGDHGVAMVRHPEYGWSLEATGTDADLRAFTYVRYPTRDRLDGTSADEGVVAVGARGEARLRRRGGTWTKEETGTDADLFAAVSPFNPIAPVFTFAAGARGTLLLRSPEGSWKRLDAGTSEDLLALSNAGCLHAHICVYGRQGLEVMCSWPQSRVGEVSCAPPPPGRRDAAGSMPASAPVLRSPWGGNPAMRFELRDQTLLTLITENYEPRQVTFDVPGAAGARAVDLDGADGFIVGSDGLVIHMALQKYFTPRVCPL